MLNFLSLKFTAFLGTCFSQPEFLFDISAAVYNIPKSFLTVLPSAQWAAKKRRVTDYIIFTVHVIFG